MINNNHGGGVRWLTSRRTLPTLLITLLIIGLLPVCNPTAAADEPVAENPQTNLATDTTEPTTPAHVLFTTTTGSYPLSVSVTKDMTLQGETVNFIRIAAPDSNGEPQPVDDSMRTILNTVNNPVANPASQLLDRIAAYSTYPMTVATTLLPQLTSRKPDMTIPGGTDADVKTVNVSPGWYLVYTSHTQSAAMLIAGKVTGLEDSAMVNGYATLDGQPMSENEAQTRSTRTQQELAKQPSTMMVQPRAATNYNLTWVPGILDKLSGTSPVPGTSRAANMDYRVNASGSSQYIIFCLDQKKQSADANAVLYRTTTNNNRIRSALWYGYKGPASIFENTEGTWGVHVTASEADQRWATHLYVAAVYTGRDPNNPNWGTYLTNARVHQITGYDQLMNISNNHQLSWNVDFRAYIFFAKKGSTVPSYWTVDAYPERVDGFTLTQDDRPGAYRSQPFVGWEFHKTTIKVETAVDKQGNPDNRTTSIYDNVWITPYGNDTVHGDRIPDHSKSGWMAGSQLMIISTLYFNDNRGHQISQRKMHIANPGADVKANTKRLVWRAEWKPSDLGMGIWHSGHYWFDTWVDTHHSTKNGQYDTGGPRYAHEFDKDYYNFVGLNIPAENMELHYPDITVNTSANSNNANPRNTNQVTDKITFTNKGTESFKIVKLTVTLHYQDETGGSKKSKAKTMSVDWLVSAGKTYTGTSSPFTPTDLFGSGNWRAGDYYFDVNIPYDGIFTTHGEGTQNSAISLDGSKDSKEQFTIKPIIQTPSGKTTAHIV